MELKEEEYMSKTKQCTKCQLVKKADDFYKDNRRTNGIRAACILCCKKGKKVWREKNLERVSMRGWRLHISVIR